MARVDVCAEPLPAFTAANLLQQGLRSGDFIEQDGSIYCVRKLHDGDVIGKRFMPYPKNGKHCAMHSGHCWRELPGDAEVVPLSQEIAVVLALVPRPMTKTKKFRWERCFRSGSPLRFLLRPPGIRPVCVDSHLDTADTQRICSAAAKAFVESLTHKVLAYKVGPTHCPLAGPDEKCHIIRRGRRESFKFVTPTGMWQCRAVIYSCSTHSYRWNLPTEEQEVRCARRHLGLHGYW